MAQGYSYSYNKIESVNNFQRNLKSWRFNLSWGLGVRALAQGYTYSDNKVGSKGNFQKILKSWE